ncbi:alpha-galactosidase [Sphingobacterium pedocola]|uniref:alpha-galactosidase n=1 Tax=Sphingobacterium pedocola TaxID=2082722 RepID=UPI001E627A73|nr:alpha-galactosidase [Sphingobacterium pedocola]
MFIAFVAAVTRVSGEIKWDGRSLTIENDKMKQVISFDRGKVLPTTIWLKDLNRELLVQGSDVPWFEFVLDGKVVNALQSSWQYHHHTVRTLSNGGEELLLQIVGQKQWKGLIVEIVKQYFPESSLTREMLRLKVVNKQSFHLQKLDGKLHFVFPQYAFVDHGVSAAVKETRIGTYAQEILPDFDPSRTWDQRNPVNNLAYAHMFAPDSLHFTLHEGQTSLTKGPFQTVELDGYTILSAYEHASQDTRRGFQTMYQANSDNAFKNDDAQGVVGESNLDSTDESLWFLGTETTKKGHTLTLATKILRGGYLQNEPVTRAKSYETVWTAIACYQDVAQTNEVVHRYVLEQITDHSLSRKPLYYYNTWGMQRAAGDVRAIYTEERIKEEIGYAASLGVDLFVLDDGWEVTQGVWTPNERLVQGIAPLIEEIKQKGMIPGIWMSPMGIDATAERFKAHPEWVILDKQGNPVKGQWNHPVFDVVSDFYDVFVDDCKWLIDQGARFFKWDAVNSFPSSLPGLHHGDDLHSPQERKDRYDYLVPFYMTKAMRELREYHPDVVVEIDLTEPQRCLVGLMPLQEGKFFWMNNGASAYGDYSTHRAKSMRGIINRFSGILPLQVFTFAVYPHNAAPFYAQRYNVNTALVAGRGFWGNLKQLNEGQRSSVYALVSKQKRVLPHISHLPIQVMGKVGASPELYSSIDREKSFGQVVGFSGSALSYDHRVEVVGKQLLAVLNHSYSLTENGLHLPFQFVMPDDTREAFILGNNDAGISIVSSTGWLNDVVLENNSLTVQIGSDTELVIRFSTKVSEMWVDGEKQKSQSKLDEGLLKYTRKAGETLRINWE